MKEIPMLFSTPMVQAELDDRKTMTRRMKGLEQINKAPSHYNFDHFEINKKGQLVAVFDDPIFPGSQDVVCPYGQPCDLLWVRETWQWIEGFAGSGYYVFKTEFKPRYEAWERDTRDGIERIEQWKPSIHMPKEAARIWLQVTDIRVERLQDISGDDVLAEGVDNGKSNKSMGVRWENMQRMAFEEVWTKINGADSWNNNDWVWVISFKVLSTTGKPDLSTINVIA
jgi:hypothetical protein